MCNSIYKNYSNALKDIENKIFFNLTKEEIEKSLLSIDTNQSAYLLDINICKIISEFTGGNIFIFDILDDDKNYSIPRILASFSNDKFLVFNLFMLEWKINEYCDDLFLFDSIKKNIDIKNENIINDSYKYFYKSRMKTKYYRKNINYIKYYLMIFLNNIDEKIIFLSLFIFFILLSIIVIYDIFNDTFNNRYHILVTKVMLLFFSLCSSYNFLFSNYYWLKYKNYIHEHHFNWYPIIRQSDLSNMNKIDYFIHRVNDIELIDNAEYILKCLSNKFKKVLASLKKKIKFS